MPKTPLLSFPGCCLLLLTFLLSLSFSSSAQEIASSSGEKKIKAGSSSFYNSSLEVLMKKFHDTYNIFFSYQTEDLKEKNIIYNPADINSHRKAEAALNKVLTPAGLTFKLVNTVYVIKYAVVEDAPVIIKTTAIDFNVKGTVKDNKGPLGGVTVTEKGTSNATTTNFNGEFILNVTGPDAVLVFSYVGYNAAEINVGGRSLINVNLDPASGELSSVVVTALGIKRDEKSLGYSVAKLDGSEVSDVKSANMVNALSGKVAGVNIRSTSPDPGSSVFITIRGQRSLYGDNQPLIVLDGIPVNNSVQGNSRKPLDNGGVVDYGNPISDINPDDIASISILKGASASALYGSRAGNGVILITTKTGAESRRGLGVSVNSTAMFDKAWQFPEFQNVFGAGDRPDTDETTSDATWGPRLNDGSKRIQWNSPTDANGDLVPTPWVAYPNRVKDFFQTGATYINNVAVTGSNKDASFRLSYTNMKNKGIVPNTGLDRNNLTLAAGYALNSKIRVNTNIAFTQNGGKNRPTFNRGSVNNVVYTLTPNVDIEKLRTYWLPGQEGLQQYSHVPGDVNNPFFIAYQLTNAFQRTRLTGNVQVMIDITRDLSLMARTGLDTYNEDRESKRAFSADGSPTGAYSFSKSYFKEQNTDFLLTYKKNVTKDLFFSIAGGGNRLDQKSNGTTLATNALVIPGLYTIGNAVAGTVQSHSGSSISERRINSLYGLGQVAYKNYLFLDLTARNDWSSTLPPANNSYFYPSASVSAVVSDMFAIKSKVLSFAKLRANWSQVGNDVGPYSLYNTLDISEWYQVNMASISSSLKNNVLKPEISTSTEFGMDLRFLSNRIGLDLTWYNTDSRNQIISIPTAAPSGYTNKLINAGELQNRGIEVTLRATPVDRNFKWNFSVNYSRNRNKVIKLTDGVTQLPLGESEGMAFYVSEGTEMGDMYARTWRTVPDGPYKGQPWLNDAGEYERVNDYAKIGNYNPDFMIGFTNNFSYKGFAFGALLDWRQGGQFHSYVAKNLLSDGRTSVTVPGRDPKTGGLSWVDDQARQRTDGQISPGYQQDGDGNFVKNTVVMDPEAYYGSYYYDFPQRTTYSASYVKLRELTLDYTFTKKTLKNIPVSSVTIGFIARNLYSWTAADAGYDPETSMAIQDGSFYQGVGSWSLPNTRSYGFKLGINF